MRLTLKLLLAATLVASAVVFVVIKKESLVKEASEVIRNVIRQENNLDIKIGKVTGNILGVIKFSETRIENPAMPQGQRLIFFAKLMTFRYQLLDFLSKQFSSKIEVEIRDSEFHWQPYVSMNGMDSPLFSWIRKGMLSQRSRWRIVVRNFKFFVWNQRSPLEGIQGVFENDHFEVKIPLRHLEWMGSDVSTELNLSGRYQSGVFRRPDTLVGEIVTEGSVINWDPMIKESGFEFTLSQSELSVTSSDFLGGAEMRFHVNFKNDAQVNLHLGARNYSPMNLSPFLRASGSEGLPQSLDLDLSVRGDWLSPFVEGRVRLHGGAGGVQFKAMEVHVFGNYPTLRLTDSHLVTTDGTVMNFAERTLEARDLFSHKTYTSLMNDSQQNKIVYGPWEFSTPKDAQDDKEVFMQRSLGKNVNLHLKKEVEEESADFSEKKPTVGFEVRLKSEDSLKFEMKEDERFLGVERRMSF